jgi:hypothetical protein
MADSKIGSLSVVLGLDSAQFETGLKRSAANANAGALNIGKGIKAGLKDVEANFRGAAGQAGTFGAALTGMGLIGVGVGAALVGTLAQVRSALAFGDEIGDTATKLAVTTDALQEYRYAVHSLGGEYTDADAALQSFAVSFGAAHAQLTKKAVKPFEALGLDAKSFATTEDALQAVIAKIAALKSSAEQAAIADKLGLTAMLPAIRAGVDEMDRLRAKAHEVGYVMDADLIAKAGEANDKFEDLQQIVGVQLHSAFVDLAPVLLSLTGLVADMAKGLRGVIDQLSIVENKSAAGLDARAQTVSKELLILKKAQLNGSGVSQLAIDNKVAELQAIENQRQQHKAAAAASAGVAAPSGTSLIPPHSSSGANKAAQVAEASAAAIESATKAELDARMSLTGDIERLAALKAGQVRQETAAANQRLQDDANAGKITQAAAAKAIALNNRTSVEKQILIAREKEADLAAKAASQEAELGGYRQQIASVQAQLAGTAQARAAIELQALADAQKIDRDQLKASLDKQFAADDITEAYRQEVIAAQASAQSAETEKAQHDARVAIAKEAVEREQNALELQIDLAQAQGALADTVIARRHAELRLLALQKAAEKKQLEAQAKDESLSVDERKKAQDRLDQLDVLYGAQAKVIERQNSLADAFREASHNVQDMADAFKSGDWLSLFDDLKQAINGLKAAFSSGGTAADKVSSVAGLVDGVGKAIGGKAGKALSWAAQGAQIGMTLGGPWGAVAGAIIGGLGSLLGGKPSNNGAIATINGKTVALSGNKRTSETSSAAESTGNAIVQGQELLKSLGLSLGTTIKSIDIGTRDLTHIFLSSGAELRSAVGDSKAAAETALRAVLDGATFVSDAQKQLVTSMEAAGAGFDDISAALQNYQAAQDIPKQIGDAILQIVDPKAYDQSQLKAAQEARRDSVKAALDAGYITADLFASVSAQLSKLEGLELDQVLAKYSDAIDSAAERQQAAADAVSKARDDLKAAYEGQVSTLKDTISEYSSVANSLRKFDESLRAGGSPQTSLAAAQAAFRAVAGKTDAASLAKLQDAGQALLDAGKAGARDQTELARIQGQVRAAVKAGAAAADAQVNLAQSQLDALNAQVSGLIEVNASVLSVASAIGALQAALVSQQLLNGGGSVANDNAIGVPHFATGGGFQVGGLGGTDSRLAQLAVSPSEYVNVSHGDSMGAMAKGMGVLGRAVAAQARQLEDVARFTRSQHDLLMQVTRGGSALVTVAA